MNLLDALANGFSDTETDQGIITKAGDIEIQAFDRALQLTLSYPGGDTEGGIQEIDPRFVLAYAWNPKRLAAGRQRLAKGIADHPIIVSEWRFPGLPIFYAVTDGMHRTIAARLAGRPVILAQVSDRYSICNPDTIVIMHKRVWKFRKNQWHFEGENESNEVLELLQRLGVKTNRSWWARWKSPYWSPKDFPLRVGR